ncbi:MAG: 2-oxoacid:acceptor oxidoreductase subunit alpha [Candidatus Glassbacteria bacterium]|nr:2-oxoacid:acceptor oxidoreductase subunit alpha [Candidatus Glassbacteria bacterium]
MAVRDLNIGMVGSGGDGVMVGGEAVVSAVARKGLNCIMLKSYGPQIRGGESSCKIRISSEKVSTQADELDVLLAFNWKDYPRFGSELMLRPGRLVIEEGGPDTPEPERPIVGPEPGAIYRIPLTSLAREATGGTRARNMVALGALGKLCSLPDQPLRHSIEKLFKSKGTEVVQDNLKAYQLGRDYAERNLDRLEQIELAVDEHRRVEERVVMTGNDAVAYGAMLAGCRFFAGYPITPSSDIMEWLSIQMPKFGGTMVQTEDEMAALGMVLGASLAGAKAMTATSGPGLSLMTEMIGLAAIAEIPCVIVDVQRGGPSTGIPTKSEQSDLMHAVYGGHGDFPRVVMAPADVSDCFDVMREAFFISEKYQIPVIVLSDGFIGHRKASIVPPDISKYRPYYRNRPKPDPDAEYLRFAFTETGVSPMSIPGMQHVLYRAAGIEHDEKGRPTSDFKVHQMMNEKRFKKLESIVQDVNFMRVYGPEKAKVAVLSWGSNKGAVRNAVKILNERGQAVKGIIPQVLYPLAVDKLKGHLAGAERVLIIELAYSRQFYKVLQTQMELPPGIVHYGRSGGQPLGIGEVVEEIEKLL